MADAGYLGYNWQMAPSELGLTLMTAVKKNMKKLMSKWQHQLLKARQRVETVYSVLKLRMGLETTLPRSVMGFFAHYVWCLTAYQLKAFGKALSSAATPHLTGGVA